MAEADRSPEHASLLAVYNHLAMPLRLPGKGDTDPQGVATALIQQTIQSVKALNNLNPSPHWEQIRRSLLKSSRVLGNNPLNEPTLLNELRELLPDEFMVVHIDEQNASILIFTDEKREHVVFEIWEASATGQSVLASEDFLEWSFPGTSVSLSLADFQNDEFLQELAKFLDQAHHENVKLYGAVAMKAQVTVAESRDTAQPHLVSRLLATIIGSLGTYVDPILLRKHVRDDACWTEGASRPWRRSPIWLSLRVALQRRLYALLGDQIGRINYKFLIALALTRFLDQASGELPLELLHGLKAKICNRMAKLEIDRKSAVSNVKAEYDRLFMTVGPTILSILQRVDSNIMAATNNWRRQQSRSLTLPKYPPKEALSLQLKKSGNYLRGVLNSQHMVHAASPAILHNTQTKNPVNDLVGRDFELFAKSCYNAADNQRRFVHEDMAQSFDTVEERCKSRANHIIRYLKDSPDAFDGGPLETSQFVLSIMEAWMRLDQDATELYPLLKEYKTDFHLPMFEDLQLLFQSDTERLHVFEQYLETRNADESTRIPGLFDRISSECFAYRYATESAAAQDIQLLRQKIDDATKKQIEAKTQELNKAMEEYRKLLQQQIIATCVCETEGGQRVRNSRCHRCNVSRDLTRQRIALLEKTLPEDDIEALSMCFELKCPTPFARYRDATWMILQRLGFRQTQPDVKAHMQLAKHTELAKHARSYSRISLASAKKSFKQTHYNFIKLPATISDVISPTGLLFEYYDAESNLWPARGFCFQSLTALAKPIMTDAGSLAQSVLMAFADAKAGRLSSNCILSTQARCPKDVPLSEFLALQTLISREYPRCLWIQILVELGQTAINFSSQPASLALSTIIQRVGPRSLDSLRTSHAIPATPDFGIRLLSRLRERLESISHSTSEVNFLEMLINLTIKLWSLTLSQRVKEEAQGVMERVRGVCYNWIQIGSRQLRGSQDQATNQRLSRQILRTALLTRKTFMIHDHFDKLGPIGAGQLAQAAIAMRRNIDRSIEQLPLYYKHAFRADFEWIRGVQEEVHTLLRAHPQALLSAIRSIYPDFFMSHRLGQMSGQGVWISCHLIDAKGSLHLQFNSIEGQLLINGHPEGNLPREYQNHPILVELFGSQPLTAWRIQSYGMEWVLSLHPLGQDVLLGSRPGTGLVIRTAGNAGVFELIPRSMFQNTPYNDLPGYLIDDHFHWLQLDTQELHIRKCRFRWETKLSSWILSLNTGQAWRRDSTLIDPASRTARQVYDILNRLEDNNFIVAYCGRNGKISVELSRMELRLTVNRFHRLQSHQLQAEIDDDQDVGTLYGLNSKLVFRSILNPNQRSVIVPFGMPRYRMSGEWPEIFIPTDKTGFAKFDIDPILGRLTCASEPRLLYFKAYLHALATSVVPDPLTGRTGTEEAIYWLSSGCAVPWQPLVPTSIIFLQGIRDLSPRSEYYPVHLKRLRRAHWSLNLSVYAQDPRYRVLVDKLLERSDNLAAFKVTTEPVHNQEEPARREEDPHLRNRLLVRHQLCRRPAFNEQQLRSGATRSKYNSRDKLDASNNLCRRVAKIVTAIQTWPASMRTTTNLVALVEMAGRQIETAAGYNKDFDAVLLSDRVDDTIVARDFGPLLHTCRGLGQENKARLAFLLGPLAFNGRADIEALMTALAFALWPELHSITTPTWDFFAAFSRMRTPHGKDLVDLIRPHCDSFIEEAQALTAYLHPKQRRATERARERHQQDIERQCAGLADLLLIQWPSLDLQIDSRLAPNFPLINIEAALETVKPVWERYVSWMDLTNYLEAVQAVLLDRARLEIDMISYTMPGLPNSSRYRYKERQRVPPLAIQDLVRLPCPISWSESAPMPYHSIAIRKPDASQQKDNINELGAILKNLAATPSKTQADFAKKMQVSLQALKATLYRQSEPDILAVPDGLVQQIQHGTMNVVAFFELIKGALRAQEVSWPWLDLGGLLPMLTKVDILQTLRRLGTTGLDFGPNTRESILHLASLLVRLQRLYRVQDAHLKDNETRVQEELKQLHTYNFCHETNPNWLLFELDSNITLRHAQVDIANATVSPSSGSNSLHQLMMGQGKTSCILPISALALATGQNLVRVVVPRALVLQTAQLLQHRLGSLNGRPVMHIPFSRKTSTKTDQIRLLRRLYEDVLRNGGVIVTTPEHSLSLMLSGIQRTIDNHLEEAQELVSMHRWLQRVSRNILDESDLILDCKTQLIYPSGTLTSVDGHPYRWQVAQKLFRLVKAQLWSLQQKYPHGIQVFESARGFPFVYFLRKEVEDELIQRLATDLTAETSILPLTPEQSALVHSFITLPAIDSNIKKRLDEWSPELRKTIYLLRGLLVHRILLHVLKKRWNVQYGIPENRAPIAVPFVAKGTPSENAEYGHCDVSILLTILAFYYGGVSKPQLQQVLGFILRSDNAGVEYERITDSIALPERWRTLQAINIKDDNHMDELHKHLRYSIVVCDLYLNYLVFPQHARQFDVKIAASGWDITGSHLNLNNLTTGFSGTIDNACLLPLTIAQQELEDFKHTNAEALVYLLEERNSQYQVLRLEGQRLNEEQLLQRLSRNRIRCLIDSGSFILELSNEEVAKLWLAIDSAAPAAIYFGTDNRAWVLYRNGLKMPLVASTFADNTADALVYFSNAHCRGSDLKLPPTTRGALTLGMYHTKDALVQSAMRLRLLPTTQSVTFFAPPEVHQAILDCLGKVDGDRLGSRDVIAWILRETCRSIEELQPLWHSQGLEYLNRTQALLENPDFCTNSRHRNDALAILCQREKLQLEDLYGTRSRLGKVALSSKLAAMLEELKIRASQFHDAGHAVHASALQEVEQEREVEQEVAHEQQVQRPHYHNPHRFAGLHRDLETFVKSGFISERSSAIEHYGSLLARTLIGKRFNVSGTTSGLYVTTAYATTVNAIPPSDNFIRPVNWILWSEQQQLAILIAPEEADLLIPMLKAVYLLSYSAPTTRTTIHFNDLTYCAIPPLAELELPLWLKVELGIFAGKLFFKFAEYEMVKTLLRADAKPPFGNRPLAFLQDWLALRRVDQDVLDTPMGYVIQGRELAENHHFFRKDAAITAHLQAHVHREEQTSHDDADDDFFDDQPENDPDYPSDDEEDREQVELEQEKEL